MPAITQDQVSQVIARLIEAARSLPDGRLAIQDSRGVTVAYVQVVNSARRPVDMPRSERPKQKLSKRARDAAKRQKPSAA